MKKIYVAAVTLSILVLSVAGAAEDNWDTLMSEIPRDDARAALDLANGWRTTQPSVQSWLTPSEIVFLFPTDERVEVPLPDGAFVVSIAPYLTRTHPCAQHSISGCRGEFTSRSFDYRVVADDGSIVAEGTADTGSNGFIDLWLPSDGSFEVSVRSPLGGATRTISTAADADTCITDMRLRP